MSPSVATRCAEPHRDYRGNVPPSRTHSIALEEFLDDFVSESVGSKSGTCGGRRATRRGNPMRAASIAENALRLPVCPLCHTRDQAVTSESLAGGPPGRVRRAGNRGAQSGWMRRQRMRSTRPPERAPVDEALLSFTIGWRLKRPDLTRSAPCSSACVNQGVTT